MARTTIYFMPGGQEKQADGPSENIILEVYGIRMKNHPLPEGANGERIIPWHRISHVHRMPEEHSGSQS
jgi:hypothetical protein